MKSAGNRTGRRGSYRLFVRMLQLTAAQPMTAAQVAKAVGFHVERVRDALWRMVRGGIAHVAGWVQPKTRSGMFMPLFSGRPGESRPYPREMAPERAFGQRCATSRVQLASFIELVRQLLVGDRTRAELLDATEIAHHRIRIILAAMRQADLVHVSSWRRASDRAGTWAECFTWGGGTDAPRPTAKPRSLIMHEYTARVRLRAAEARAAA